VVEDDCHAVVEQRLAEHDNVQNLVNLKRNPICSKIVVTGRCKVFVLFLPVPRASVKLLNIMHRQLLK
jgi:hypothetical protein